MAVLAMLLRRWRENAEHHERGGVGGNRRKQRGGLSISSGTWSDRKGAAAIA
jgi:hypothetical protein